MLLDLNFYYTQLEMFGPEAAETPMNECFARSVTSQ